MKILFLCVKSPYPPNDGGAIAMLRMIEGFKKNGHDITVLYMKTKKHPYSFEEAPKNILELAKYIPVEVPAEISATAALKNLLFSKLPYNAERFISNKFKLQLTDILQNNKFDIVQIEGLYAAPYIETIRQLSRSIIAFRAHNIEHEIWDRLVTNEKNPLKKYYKKIIASRLRKFEESFINTYDFLVPISPRDANMFSIKGNHKPVMVCPTGIEPNKYNIRHTQKKASLFHLGSLDWEPNLEGLLWFINKVFPLIIDKFPNTEFHIAGRNAPKSFIHSIQKKGIVFHGEIDDAQKFINDHSIMIVPLFSGSGMRIKIIEGMAMGKPIVTSSVGAEGIPCSSEENIFIANTVKENLQYISHLLNNEEKIEQIGKNARTFVEKNFNNTVKVKELSEFYIKNLQT
ncbi:MAG: hypothetical protein C0594_15345 [Marinilabiliales bacterium]|nr:MAG: hypothetical protein C0594_15345 [Marinilabiliales bacterium]